MSILNFDTEDQRVLSYDIPLNHCFHSFIQMDTMLYRTVLGCERYKEKTKSLPLRKNKIYTHGKLNKMQVIIGLSAKEQCEQ